MKLTEDKGWGRNINHKGFIVKGWGYNEQQLKWYKEKLRKSKNGIVVEIGVYGGASILSVIDVCVNNNITIYGIDPWEKTNIVNGTNISESEKEILTRKMVDARTNLELVIKKLKYSNIKLIQDTSESASSQFKNKTVDLVYIDGDHSYESVTKDLTIWCEKLKPNGIIWGDDFGWVPVRKAIQDFSKLNKMNINRLSNGKWYLTKK